MAKRPDPLHPTFATKSARSERLRSGTRYLIRVLPGGRRNEHARNFHVIEARPC
jgi:hypothetical protein